MKRKYDFEDYLDDGVIPEKIKKMTPEELEHAIEEEKKKLKIECYAAIDESSDGTYTAPIDDKELDQKTKEFFQKLNETRFNK